MPCQRKSLARNAGDPGHFQENSSLGQRSGPPQPSQDSHCTTTVDEGLDEKILGRRLKTFRLRQGLTQAELAAKVGLKQPMLSLYERGDVRLTALLAVRLAKALAVSCDEMLGLKESRENGHLQDRALVRRLQKLETLSRRDKQTLLRTIDRFLKGSGAS